MEQGEEAEVELKYARVAFLKGGGVGLKAGAGKIYDGSDRLISENWIIIKFLMFSFPLHDSAFARILSEGE